MVSVANGKKRCPVTSTSQGCMGKAARLAGHKNRVDDVDDAVGLEDIGCGDGSCSAFSVGEHDMTTGHRRGQVFALHRLQHGLAVTLLDHLHELSGADAAGNDVVGED